MISRWMPSFLSSPAVANGVVYYGSGITMFAFNASSGTLLWSFNMQGSVYATPAIVNGVVYVGSDGGEYAFHLPGTTP